MTRVKQICKVNVLIKTIISITKKSHFDLAYVYENFCECVLKTKIKN